MLAELDVVILCGGLGKRLRSINDQVSKVMVAFEGDPFLDILINYLKEQGLRRFILCTGHKAESVEDYYRKKDFGVKIEFSRENEPLGTGGAVKNAKKLIKSDAFFVLNGDCFCDVDFKKFYQYQLNTKATASLVAIEVPESSDYGTIAMDKNGKVSQFREKGLSGKNYINAGRYCFTKEVFSIMPKENKFSLEYDVFPKLINHGFYAFKASGKFFDIGTPERFFEFKEYYGQIKKIKN